MAHHFAIGFGAFRVGHVLLKLCLHQGGNVNPPNVWFSAPAVGSKLIFSQNIDLFGCENRHYARAPWTTIMLIRFYPKGPRQIGIAILRAF